jgi:hypothetical protein
MSAVIWANSASSAGRHQAAGVELVEGAQLRRGEPPRPEPSQRGSEPLGQAAGAIVVADAVQYVGHLRSSCEASRGYLGLLPSFAYWR